MKFLLAKKAGQMLPRLVMLVAALILTIVMTAAAGLGAVVAFATTSTTQPSGGVNLQGWTNPVGYTFKWDTYNSGSHAMGAVDIPVNEGDPIYAAADGLVVWAGWQGTYGLAITLQHAGGDGTHYAHMSMMIARKGEFVKAGQVIGLVGHTGGNYQPHLHFETRQGSTDRSAGVPAYAFMLARGVDLGPCYSNLSECYVAGG